ncbi:hypothetical protein C8J57DRAFT_1674006 [Mycena rebaudengoi]|nr:hypothetical protein C8J57DRAFT_1674006 [Mycena rebaudengoi]
MHTWLVDDSSGHFTKLLRPRLLPLAPRLFRIPAPRSLLYHHPPTEGDPIMRNRASPNDLLLTQTKAQNKPRTHAQCRQCAERETPRQHLRRRRRCETRAHRCRLDVRRSTALSAPVTHQAAGPSTCAATPAVRFNGQNVHEARNFGGRSGVLVLWSRQRSPRRRLRASRARRERGRARFSVGLVPMRVEDSAHQATTPSTSHGDGNGRRAVSSCNRSKTYITLYCSSFPSL